MLSATGGRSWRRRVGVAFLVWAMAASVLAVAAGPAAAVPGACDADGDGDAAGTTETVFSDGDDDEAADLEAGTGLVLAAPEAAHRWRVTVCVEAVDGGERVVVVGAPVQELHPDAAAWEADALDDATGKLTPLLYRPGPRTSPHVDGVQFVGIEMWLAVDPMAWATFTETGSGGDDGEVTVTATATPRVVVWEFTDGVTRVCEGPGIPYSPGAAGRAPCGRDFEHTTEVTPVTVGVSIEYDITWTSSLGNGGVVAQRGEVERYDLMVGEVQTYLTDGTRPAPPSPDALEEIASTQPINDSNCSITSPLDCSLSDIVDAVVGVLADAGLALLPEAVRSALIQVWSFVQGCAQFVGDAFSSIVDLFEQLGELVSDPAGFIADKFALVQELYQAIRADPPGFAGEFLNETFQLDMMRDEPARWAGMIGCEVAVAILTGAAGSRFAGIVGDLDRLRDFTRRNNGDNNNDNNNDSDGDGDGPGTCPASSFPTGTLVLAADGTRQPIETIDPGDAVAAFDPATGTWAPRDVLAQWSYLDTDEMATVALTDGSTVSATDHHRFYDAAAGEFDELEDLTPGDVLVTPDGPVTVEAVTVWPSAPTLVWELTVAVDHTFAVLAGDHAVAVHNRCDPPPDAAQIDAALRGAGVEGITVDQVQGAWSRYTGDWSQQRWLDRYIGLRRDADRGRDHETETLSRLGVDHNYDAFPEDNPTFIPDGVRGTDPPQFIEIKDYQATILRPGTNAGAQINYLMAWARDNPGGGTPSFELWISNPDNLSPQFQDLLTRAQRANVEIMVNGAPWVPPPP